MTVGRSNVRVGIVGAGLGGMTLAAMLVADGYDVTVFEQAPAFTRLGAGIHVGPNMIKVMRRLGIEAPLLEVACHPDSWNSVHYKTGDTLFRLPLRDVAPQYYGAAYLTMHRADFHALLESTFPAERVKFNKRLVAFSQDSNGVKLDFADNTSAETDILVGADGVNSKVREQLLGFEKAQFTGHVAYRGMVPLGELGNVHIGDCTKWWGPDRHLMVYFMTPKRNEVYFVGIVPEESWEHEKSVVDANPADLVDAFKDFHPSMRAMTEATKIVTKWAVFEREPLPIWSRGRVVLLGDACHPMKPHMGQGAAMAIEDAAILARCFENTDAHDFKAIFAQYELNRVERASQIQAESHENRWLLSETDPSWVFRYDAVSEPLKAS